MLGRRVAADQVSRLHNLLLNLLLMLADVPDGRIHVARQIILQHHAGGGRALIIHRLHLGLIVASLQNI